MSSEISLRDRLVSEYWVRENARICQQKRDQELQIDRQRGFAKNCIRQMQLHSDPEAVIIEDPASFMVDDVHLGVEVTQSDKLHLVCYASCNECGKHTAHIVCGRIELSAILSGEATCRDCIDERYKL